MRRSAGTALSALTMLDPLRSVGPRHRTPHQNPAETEMELQIARILAVPRREAPIYRRNADPLPQSTLRGNRRRYGALGLVTSAAIAVIATLLWVSPSAGAPTAQANGAHARVIQSRVSVRGSLARYVTTDRERLSTAGTIVLVQ
jgi:hypothetical protein